MTNRIKKKSSALLPCLLLSILITAAYLLARLSGLDQKKELIQGGMAVMLALIGVAALPAGIRRRLSWRYAGRLLIAAGIVLRIGYMLYTGCHVRSHDLGEISLDGGGHAAYLLTLLEKGALPDNNRMQFYQQPLFYLLGAAVSRGVNGLLHCSEAYYLVDAAKLVSCFASCAVLLLTVPLCRTLETGEKGCAAAVAAVAFLPSFTLSGGRVNCDMLACLFMVLAVLYTLRLYREPGWKNFLILAVVYGLGMMTKISCATVALFTAAVFCLMLVRAVRERRAGTLLGRLAAFGAVSLPLGLWYSVRNYLLFGQSLTYVLPLSVDTELYVGNRPVMGRFFLIDWQNLLQTPYADPWNDYNLPVYQLKSSLFGEFTYQMNDAIPVLLLLAGGCLAVLSVYAAIRQGRRNGKNRYVVSLCAIIVIFLCSTLAFNWNYPFGCSMDFRYSLLLPVLFAPLLGRTIEENGRFACLAAPVLVLFGVFSAGMMLAI